MSTGPAPGAGERVQSAVQSAVLPAAEVTDPRHVEVTDPRYAELADVRYAELVVAGNPWLRALWAVGTLTVVAGFALTVIAQYAFSVPPASGIYDPSAYILPSIAQAVAQPLVTAGVIALVAATALRIVAWRPSAARTILRD